jgi:hypothetical protein
MNGVRRGTRRVMTDISVARVVTGDDAPTGGALTRRGLIAADAAAGLLLTVPSDALAASAPAQAAGVSGALPVVVRRLGWDVGCLYNQETDESPQLYFSHMFKVGDPVQLAHEVRAGLDHTAVGH